MTKLFLQISLGIILALTISSLGTAFVLKTIFENKDADHIPPPMLDLVFLLKDRFEKAPKTDWPKELESVRQYLPFPIDLIAASDLPMSHNQADFPTDRPFSSQTAKGLKIFIPLGDGKYFVAMGAPGMRQPFHYEPFLISICISLPIVGVIGFLLAYPVVRRLRVLEQAAAEIESGNLSARANIGSNDAIGSLARRFNRMAEKVQTLLESRRHLLQAVSHELRTPISRLSFRLEMLETDREPSSRQNRIAAMENDLNELENLIAELLLYCRFDKEEPLASAESLPVEEAIKKIVEQLAAFPSGKQITIHSRVAADYQIQANRRYFERVIQNLVMNALQHARASIAITIAAENGTTVFEVADDGPGIPEADRQKIFEPFAVLNESRSRESGGVGLGLAIVRRIVEAHGGAVFVGESESGGAQFIVKWPALKLG